MVFIITAILFIPSYNDNIFHIKSKVFAFVAQYPLGKSMYFTWLEDELSNEIITALFIISGIILAFSKEKLEDEFIQSIRLKSLLYSTYFTYIMTLIAVFFTYGVPFLSIVTLLIFIHLIVLIIFYYMRLFIYKKQFSYENED